MKFTNYTLKELVEIKYGKNQKDVQSDFGSIPIYGTGGLMGYATKALYDKPSVLIGRKGTISKVKYVDHPFWTVDTLFYTIVNENIVIPKFLYYLMSLIDFNTYNEGTTIPSLRTETLNRIEFNIPSIDDQIKILSVIEPIDQKISFNSKINDNLSEQLQAIFANLFLGFSMEEELPDGWSLVKLKDIAKFSQGVQVPVNEQLSSYEEGYERFIRIVDVTQGNEKDIRYIKDRPRGHVKEDEIFMIRYGTPGIISWNYNGIIANNLFKISPTTERATFNFLYSFLKTEKVLAYLKGNAVSSTMPAINFSTLNEIDVVIPDKQLMMDFSQLSEVIRLKQLSILNENITLSHLREELLPKLVSGEIDVSEVTI